MRGELARELRATFEPRFLETFPGFAACPCPFPGSRSYMRRISETLRGFVLLVIDAEANAFNVEVGWSTRDSCPDHFTGAPIDRPDLKREPPVEGGLRTSLGLLRETRGESWFNVVTGRDGLYDDDPVAGRVKTGNHIAECVERAISELRRYMQPYFDLVIREKHWTESISLDEYRARNMALAAKARAERAAKQAGAGEPTSAAVVKKKPPAKKPAVKQKPAGKRKPVTKKKG